MGDTHVFISYSHRDEAMFNFLRDHLAPLRQQGLIEEWHDRRIAPGDDWGQEICEQLQRCQVILLLLSASFFASEYISGVEATAALKRHKAGDARVIPIILRPVDWERTELGKLQALPTNAKPIATWKNRDQAYRDVARGIRAALLRLQSSSPAGSATSGVTSTTEFFLNHTSFLRLDRQAEFRERTGVPLDHYDIRVVLDAEDPAMLDQVSRVEYTLDPAYPEPVRVRTAQRDRQSQFLLKELANGEYLLRAAVHLKSGGTPIQLRRYITLWRSGPELT
jgi:hypothetical protein